MYGTHKGAPLKSNPAVGKIACMPKHYSLPNLCLNLTCYSLIYILHFTLDVNGFFSTILGQFDFYNGFGGGMGMGGRHGGQGGRGGAPGAPPMPPMSGLGPLGWMFGGMFGGGEAAEGGGGMFGMPGMQGMFGGRFGNPYSRSLGGLSFGLPGGNMFPTTSPAPPTPQPQIPVRGAFDSMLPNTKTFDNPGTGGFGTTQSPDTALNFGVSSFTGARKCMKPSFLNQCSCARSCGSGTVDYGLCEDQPGVQQNPNTPAFCCPESVHMMCLSGDMNFEMGFGL